MCIYIYIYVLEVLAQLRDRSREHVDLRVEGLHGLGLLLARLPVRGELRVAPALVLGLLVRLLHQAHDEVLEHYPRDPDPEIRKNKRLGTTARTTCF